MRRRWGGVLLMAWAGIGAATAQELFTEPPPPPPSPEEMARIDARAFAETFVAWICSDQHYPIDALENNWEGTVRVAVVIGRDGRVKAASVAHSSGHPTLDAEAVRKVLVAREPPVPPALLRGREFSLQLPVEFRLDR